MVLPLSMRIRGYRCFDYLYKEGLCFHSSSMVLRVAQPKEYLLKSKTPTSTKRELRCAISISNKVSKKAVVRNKIRRLLHSRLRYIYDNSQNSIRVWALFSIKPNSSIHNSRALIKDCDKLLIKAGLLK